MGEGTAPSTAYATLRGWLLFTPSSKPYAAFCPQTVSGYETTKLIYSKLSALAGKAPQAVQRWFNRSITQ
jgi:hypothetical protein